jgi:hypothetical protein
MHKRLYCTCTGKRARCSSTLACAASSVMLLSRSLHRLYPQNAALCDCVCVHVRALVVSGHGSDGTTSSRPTERR